jgi:YidC/Oxa1 family membrane protein insertase
MNFRSISGLTTVIFCLLLVMQVFQPELLAQDANNRDFSAVGGPAENITLGSIDPNTGFKFLLELTTRGAAIEKATLSEFDDLNHKIPLVLLSPAAKPDGTKAFSMANQSLVLADCQLRLPLDKLDWNAVDVTRNEGREKAVFEAIIKNKATGEPLIKLTKTYIIEADLYHVDCNLTIENLSAGEEKISVDMAGPVGIEKEDPRSDTRKAIGAFRNTEGQIVTTALDVKKLEKAKAPEQRQLSHRGGGFIWAAITNKYFAAILIPTPDANMNFCNWVVGRFGWYSNPDESGVGNIGIDLKTTTFTLAAAGQAQSDRNLNFRLFIGPKDKTLFDKVKQYKDLAFVQTVDFMACCCPSAIIYPLGFGILALMKGLYYFIPNYGVVIIIFVLLVRLILHPLTRKSQVSMSEYAKFNALPEVQEVRKKYGKNLMETNRHISELQKQHGLSHSAMLMGMLPMLVQMPIWIALYGAIYASIDLRDAKFLPFWITNLSAPDALFKFPGGLKLPYFGDTFNLLPILMGIAFYLQQKLTPSQSASADPQMAQQQKMMMFMLPLMFPFMLYTSPSGLNLYIMASTFGGVIEQYVIKKHIREKELAKEQGLVAVTSKTGGKVKKKKPKPFFKI